MSWRSLRALSMMQSWNVSFCLCLCEFYTLKWCLVQIYSKLIVENIGKHTLQGISSSRIKPNSLRRLNTLQHTCVTLRNFCGKNFDFCPIPYYHLKKVKPTNSGMQMNPHSVMAEIPRVALELLVVH